VIRAGREPGDVRRSEPERGSAAQPAPRPALRWFALLACGAGLFALAAAHTPWLRAGLAAGEYAELLDPARGGPWLARLTLAWQRAAGAVSPPGVAPLLLRSESLAAVVLFALGMAVFLARALGPWLGEERARTAAWLFGLLFLLHPLLVDGAAPLAARPGRLALACAGLGAALFLGGRQEGREGRTVAALAVYFLAGLFAPDALPCVLLLALAEYTSSHRHRPRALRRRTALTTFGLFGAAYLLATFWADSEPLLAGARSLRELLFALSTELGHLCVPSSAPVGAALLVAALLPLLFHPLFHAARVAPRLWGGLVLCWSLALGCALLWWGLGSGAGARTRELLALAVLCAGLSLAASARDGRRTVALAVLAGLVLVPLAQSAARPWLEAARVTRALFEELATHVAPGLEDVLVLDPPGAGLPGDVSAQLGWLLHPALVGPAAEGAPFAARRVRGIAREALLVLAREPLAAEVLGPRVRVRVAGEERTLVTTPPRPLATGRRPWRTELGHTFEDGLDPRALEGLEVVAELETRADELERLSWSTRAGLQGELRGRVGEERGRRVARFDLGASLEWLLADDVRSLALSAGRRSIERAEFLARLPLPTGEARPLRAQADWLFRVTPPQGSESLSLLVIELDSLRSQRLTVTREGPSTLRVAGAERALAGTGSARFRRLWALEFRAGEHVLARATGIVDPHGDSP